MIFSGRWVDYYPISLVDGESSLEFKVRGSGDEYTDLSQTYLYFEATFTDGVDGALVNQVSGPVNLLLHSLFSQVDVSLNVILVTSSVNTYA
jgi:hypothetical protein